MTKFGCCISLLNYLMAFFDLRVNVDFLSINVWWLLHHPIFYIALFLIILLSSFKSNYISFLNLNVSYILFNLSQMLFPVAIIVLFYLQRKHFFPSELSLCFSFILYVMGPNLISWIILYTHTSTTPWK